MSLQRDNPVGIQYFPKEGRFDKMYFPYYGKRIHVSTYWIGALVGSKSPSVLLTAGLPPPLSHPPTHPTPDPRRITCSPWWP